MHMLISQEMKEQRRESALRWDMGMLSKSIEYDLTQRKINYSGNVQFNEAIKECRQGAQDVTDNDCQLITEFSEVNDNCT